jgi:hypothetical protein
MINLLAKHEIMKKAVECRPQNVSEEKNHWLNISQSRV